MRICMLCSNFERVPPIKYNFERITYYLVEELIKRGHEVTLYARGDSKTSAKLESVISEPSKDYSGLNDYDLISKAYQSANKFDIIHSQFGDFKTIYFAPLVKTPSLLTLRNVLTEEQFRGYEKTQHYVSISNAQRKQYPKLNYADTIYHGIPVDKIEFNKNPDDYLIFIGRLVPSKGPHEAIQIAKETGKKLLLLGDVPLSPRLEKSNYREYLINKEYRKKLDKNIDNDKIRNPGFIQHDKIFDFLKKATALLFPVQYEEPFGVVLAETPATGTPIIGYNLGSIPEIVKHGKTGFVVDKKKGIEGMVEAVKRIKEINREDCRRHAEENFTVKKMTDKYEKVYQRIIENPKK